MPLKRLLRTLLALMCIPVVGCDRLTGSSRATDPAVADDHHDDVSITVTLFTSTLELFLERPYLVRGEKAPFLAHATDVKTGNPVRSGTLVLEATGPDDATVSVTLDEPNFPGLFIPEPVFATPGRYSTSLRIEAESASETFSLGELIVYADNDAAHEAIHDAEANAGEALPDLSPFLMEQQWKIRMLLAEAEHRTLTHRVTVPGKIVARHEAEAVASPPVAGRLLPPEGKHFPHLGERVEAGQVLALVEPALPITDDVQLRTNRAQMRALQMEIALRELDLDRQATEVERVLTRAEARLDYVRRALERVEKLQAKGIATTQRADESQQELKLAQADYEGAVSMKQSYEAARERLDKLRAELGTSVTDDAPASLRLPIRAPIAGEVVVATCVEGEHADTHEEVFRIIDTESVWVLGHVSEFDLATMSARPGASMTLPAYPGERYDITGTLGGTLVHFADVVEPASRTVAIRYELPNPDRRLRVGMLVDLHLATQRVEEVVAVPSEAVVTENGRPIAFVLVDGETFQKRFLELGVRDGGYIEIRRGVLASERVVTRGAYAIKLAAREPPQAGHGHMH
jgi:RND family efflux transporter MFP subunit